MNGARQPREWTGIAGIHANLGKSGPGLPTVGVTVYRCDCCGKINVAIACVAEGGEEVNVILPVERALDVADAIATGAQDLANAGGLL